MPINSCGKISSIAFAAGATDSRRIFPNSCAPTVPILDDYLYVTRFHIGHDFAAMLTGVLALAITNIQIYNFGNFMQRSIDYLRKLSNPF